LLVELPREFRSPGYAAAINEDGKVAGQFATAERRNHACVWDSSSFRDLDEPGGRLSGARGINRHGHVVGEMQTTADHNLHAFFWDGKSVKDLGMLGGRESRALAINDGGLIAGYSSDTAGLWHAVVWREGITPVVLEPLSPTFPHAQAVAMNNEGIVVGSSFNQTTGRAVLWRDGRAESLEAVEAEVRSIAAGINDEGQVVGTFEVDHGLRRRACMWSKGTMRDLHGLGLSSTATSINRSGHVVGSYTSNKGEERAFVWKGREMHDLTGLLEGATKIALRFALMIDDRGWIAGVAESGGLPSAFLARPR
jgi:probable HAF family extracellular repeat protein